MTSKVQKRTARRRAIYEAGEEFTPLEIFERDNWTCGICQEPISRYIRYPAWKSATIDHKVPICVALRDGWPVEEIHTRDNVQAAHRRCNELKADRVGLDLTDPTW